MKEKGAGDAGKRLTEEWRLQSRGDAGGRGWCRQVRLSIGDQKRGGGRAGRAAMPTGPRGVVGSRAKKKKGPAGPGRGVGLEKEKEREKGKGLNLLLLNKSMMHEHLLLLKLLK